MHSLKNMVQDENRLFSHDPEPKNRLNDHASNEGLAQSYVVSPKDKKLKPALFTSNTKNPITSASKANYEMPTSEPFSEKDFPPLDFPSLEKDYTCSLYNFFDQSDIKPLNLIDNFKNFDQNPPSINSPYEEKACIKVNSDKVPSNPAKDVSELIHHSFVLDENSIPHPTNKLTNKYLSDVEHFKSDNYPSNNAISEFLTTKENHQEKKQIDPRISRKQDKVPYRITSDKKIQFDSSCGDLSVVLDQRRNYNKRRKVAKCKCKNSNCQRNYCECHRDGKTCSAKCRCIDCKNNTLIQEHPISMQNIAIGSNYNLPEIDEPIRNNRKAQSNIFDGTRKASGRPTKCNCRKTLCLRNYCACFVVGSLCSGDCACISCGNRGNNTKIKKYKSR